MKRTATLFVIALTLAFVLALGFSVTAFADPTPGTQVHLPILTWLGDEADACDVVIEVQNVGAWYTKAAILFWGAPGACPPQCNGPFKVECSGLLKAGSTWNFIGPDSPAQVPAGAKKGIVFSLSAEQVGGDILADAICETLFARVRGDCDEYRRWKKAYDEGLVWRGFDLGGIARGQPLAVEVVRKCQTEDMDAPVVSAYSGISEWELGAWDFYFGGFTFYTPLLYADQDGLNSWIYIQNAGLECTSVEIWLKQQGECIRATIDEIPALAPGETIQYNVSDLMGPFWQGNAWIRTSVPAAIAVDNWSNEVLMTYVGRPAELNYTYDPEQATFTHGSQVAFGPLIYREHQGWNTNIQVQNLSSVVNAKVKVYFLDNSGDIIKTVVDWICPRGTQTFPLAVIDGLPGNWVGSVRAESQEWWTPGDPKVLPPNILAIAELIRYNDPAQTVLLEGVAYNLFPEWQVYDWQVGYEWWWGTDLIGIPSLMNNMSGGGETGLTTELAIQNVVAKPGFTDFAIYIYDQNGLLDFVCEKLNEKQVEYINIADDWNYINDGFKGSAVISVTVWEHHGSYSPGLAAVKVERFNWPLMPSTDPADDAPGDQASASEGFPIPRIFPTEVTSTRLNVQEVLTSGDPNASPPVAGDPLWERPTSGSVFGACGASGLNVLYDVYRITHLGGTLQVSMDASGLTPLADPFVAVYGTSQTASPLFDPNDPCWNIVAADDNGGPGLNAALTLSVPAGTYYVVATSFNGAPAMEGSYRLKATSTYMTEGFVFDFQGPQAPTCPGQPGPCVFSLFGNVADQDTQMPIAGARVDIAYADGTTATVYTDSNGNYFLNAKAGIPFTITASKAGYSTVTRSYGAQVCSGELAVDFVLKSNLCVVEISGNVIDKRTGRPINAASVTADGSSDTTDSTGYYSMSLTKANALQSIAMQASKSGYYNSGPEGGNPSTVCDDVVANFELWPRNCTAGLSGQIIDERTLLPINNATVHVRRGGTTIAQDETDSTGNYFVPGITLNLLEGVSGETLTVHVAPPAGYNEDSATVTFDCDETDQHNFELTPTSSTAQLFGYVADKFDADPIAGVDVDLYDARIGPAGWIATVTTDASGWFDFGVVDLTQFRGPEPVAVELCASGWWINYETMCETFHLSRDQVAEQDFELRSLTCTGQIKKHVLSDLNGDGDLDPVEGIGVEVIDSQGNTVGYGVTDAAGLVDFVLPEGDYTLVTHSSAFEQNVEQVTVECGVLHNVTNVLTPCDQDVPGSVISIKEGTFPIVSLFADEDFDAVWDAGEWGAQSGDFGDFTLTLPAGDIPYDIQICVDYNGDYAARPAPDGTLCYGPITIECGSAHLPVELDLLCLNDLYKTYVDSEVLAPLPGLEVTASIVWNPWYTPEQLADIERDPVTGEPYWQPVDDDGDGVYDRAIHTETTDGTGTAHFANIPADSWVMLEVDPASAPGYVGPWIDWVYFDDEPDGVGECPGDVFLTNELESEGQIVGYVFDDFDGGGTPGPGAGEFNQDGIRVYLYEWDSVNGVIGPLVTFVDTGPQGWFAFTGVLPGDYILKVDNILSCAFTLGPDDKDRLDFDNLNSIWYSNVGSIDGGICVAP